MLKLNEEQRVTLKNWLNNEGFDYMSNKDKEEVFNRLVALAESWDEIYCKCLGEHMIRVGVRVRPLTPGARIDIYFSTKYDVYDD